MKADNVYFIRYYYFFEKKIIYIYIYIWYSFTTEGFFEVAIESWSEWDALTD